jgi:hypothetical protein
VTKWIVEVIDPGCGCCSFVPVGQYDTEKEALDSAGGMSGYLIYEEEEYEEYE